MSDKIIKKSINQEYKYGFVTEIEQEKFPPGLNEDIVRWISKKKNEPEFLLNRRLKAFHHFQSQIFYNKIIFLDHFLHDHIIHIAYFLVLLKHYDVT